jgi:hypothetical protein
LTWNTIKIYIDRCLMKTRSPLIGTIQNCAR